MDDGAADGGLFYQFQQADNPCSLIGQRHGHAFKQTWSTCTESCHADLTQNAKHITVAVTVDDPTLNA